MVTKRKADIQSLYEFCVTVDAGSNRLLDDYNYYRLKEGEYEEQRAAAAEEDDRAELDRIDSIIKIHNAKVEIILALFDLCALMEKNPYPGERMNILTAAHTLLPDVTISGRHGKAAWLLAFAEIRLLTDRRIYFPAEGGIYAIEEIEYQLHEATLDGYIPASALAGILLTDIRTQLYKDTKQSLLDRGWAWQKRRIDGTMTATILPPTTTLPSYRAHPCL